MTLTKRTVDDKLGAMRGGTIPRRQVGGASRLVCFHNSLSAFDKLAKVALLWTRTNLKVRTPRSGELVVPVKASPIGRHGPCLVSFDILPCAIQQGVRPATKVNRESAMATNDSVIIC